MITGNVDLATLEPGDHIEVKYETDEDPEQVMGPFSGLRSRRGQKAAFYWPGIRGWQAKNVDPPGRHDLGK
ncbi:hypothetical protein [Paenibacillus mucilaginosus]|uniref:hypothetical protein n=1 Tax=Paenibacillus mucilaginosus TaxID=61624 RepID=UPI0005A0497B|nr:hypothetical protein [Paenibacillus mucilaginosus]MCG7217881.1 hypothetical protein [Paenibacillus mucilaginosus]WDM29093.1 hypothetical protein KCX80_07985 [Paenibacillus mucilaginosus]